MIVDVHAHGLSEDFIIETAKDPGRDWKVEIAGPRHYVAADYGPLDPLLYDVEERLASLRSRRVVLQLICPPPPLVAALGARSGCGADAAPQQIDREARRRRRGIVGRSGCPGNRRAGTGRG